MGDRPAGTSEDGTVNPTLARDAADRARIRGRHRAQQTARDGDSGEPHWRWHGAQQSPSLVRKAVRDECACIPAIGDEATTTGRHGAQSAQGTRQRSDQR